MIDPRGGDQPSRVPPTLRARPPELVEGAPGSFFSGGNHDRLVRPLRLRFARQAPLPYRRPRPPAPACRRARLCAGVVRPRSEEHTTELQSLMRISYDVFCMKRKKNLT